MRVAMYYSNKDIRLENIPIPKISKDEVLVKIVASGICGSDCLEWYRIGRVPLVLGHEVAGVISEVGQDVRNFKQGDRVIIAHHVPCGKCHYCLAGHETVCDTLRKTNIDPGGFAEYARVPAINVEKGLFKIPDNLPFDEATLVEPLACVLRGQRQANFNKGKSVFVLGSGMAGLLHIILARHNGARRVFASDISDFRLRAAKRFGADHVFDSKKFDINDFVEKNNSRLADLVILCTGAVSAIEQAFKLVERGGTILFFAPVNQGLNVSVPINDLFWRTEISMTSSYAGSPKDYLEALSLISTSNINVKDLITHHMGLGDISKGFKMVEEAGESIKIVIDPQE